MQPPSITLCNPLRRTPLALIIDDSCPVINLTYYWIRQRHAWLAKHHPGMTPLESDGNAAKLHRVPQTIPADFAVKWGEWCSEQGIKGKFSMVPYPAGVARLDQGFADFPRQEFDAWMRATREVIWPNFDITCEMLTHTHVVDLATWRFTEAWEQYEWVNPPVEPLTDYIAAALTILKNAGLPCEGVTSPGAFGHDQEAAYARATLQAMQRVYGNDRPFYFLHVADPPEVWPDTPVWWAEKEKGVAVASIIGCTHDWFGGWTGYDAGSADLFLTADLQDGRLAPVLARELPCILVGHWPGMYYGGDEVGFAVLKEVKRRLDAYDPDGVRTRWMKTSAIGHYAMARNLSDIAIQPEPEQPGAWRITIHTHFPTSDFTLQIDRLCSRIQVNGHDLAQVYGQRNFREGTFYNEGKQTVLAFALAVGETIISLQSQ